MILTLTLKLALGLRNGAVYAQNKQMRNLERGRAALVTPH